MTVCCLYDEILYFIIQFDFKMAGSETVVERCIPLVTSVSPHEESMFSSDVLSSFLYRAQKLTFSIISINKHYAYRHC